VASGEWLPELTVLDLQRHRWLLGLLGDRHRHMRDVYTKHAATLVVLVDADAIAVVLDIGLVLRQRHDAEVPLAAGSGWMSSRFEVVKSALQVWW
jgi:hypothetical protein